MLDHGLYPRQLAEVEVPLCLQRGQAQPQLQQLQAEALQRGEVLLTRARGPPPKTCTCAQVTLLLTLCLSSGLLPLLEGVDGLRLHEACLASSLREGVAGTEAGGPHRGWPPRSLTPS